MVHHEEDKNGEGDDQEEQDANTPGVRPDVLLRSGKLICVTVSNEVIHPSDLIWADKLRSPVKNFCRLLVPI